MWRADNNKPVNIFGKFGISALVDKLERLSAADFHFKFFVVEVDIRNRVVLADFVIEDGLKNLVRIGFGVSLEIGMDEESGAKKYGKNWQNKKVLRRV